MKIIDVKQGSSEWVALRFGRVTASRFSQVITEKTMKPSASIKKLVSFLLAEKEFGYSLEDFEGNQWTERGKQLEAEARTDYAFQKDVEIEDIGFVMTDDERAGASPDGKIVGVPAGIEIKCFEAAHHMRCLLGYEDPVKQTQLQGQLWVCEWDYVDQWGWNPKLPPVDIRTYRNEPFIAALETCVGIFAEEYDRQAENLTAMGVCGRVETLERVLAEVPPEANEDA